MAANDDPLKIIPVNFGVKFNPPKLGLEYHLRDQPQIQQIYEIALLPFFERQQPVDEVVAHIFSEHRNYLHPRVIQKAQVKRLVERVFAKLQAANNKENSSQAINKPAEVVAEAPKPSSAMQAKPVNQPVKDTNVWNIEQGPDSERSQEARPAAVQQPAATGNNNAPSEHNLSSDQYEDSMQNSVLINNTDDGGSAVKQDGGFLAGSHLASSVQEQAKTLNQQSQQQPADFSTSQPDEYGDEPTSEVEIKPQQATPAQEEIVPSDEDEDVIDIDNPEDLARRGLKRVQIEDDDQEYLLDAEGNIFNLKGEFVGAADGDLDTSQQEGF